VNTALAPLGEAKARIHARLLAEAGTGSLADRVAAADGSLDIVSPPGHGTRLRCSIPLQPARTEVEAPTSGHGAAVVGAAAGATAGGGSHG